jgi:hypothetical protein
VPIAVAIGFGAVAQLGEHRIDNLVDGGSIPPSYREAVVVIHSSAASSSPTWFVKVIIPVSSPRGINHLDSKVHLRARHFSRMWRHF